MILGTIEEVLREYLDVFTEKETFDDLIEYFLQKHPNKELAAATLAYKFIPEMCRIIQEQQKTIELLNERSGI